tara:strand:- start:3011 stop:3883 length:873 start_codon:yes stop_codon:yes gene_type:complete
VRIEPPPAEVVDSIVHTALAEDRALEDITTQATINPQLNAFARLVAKQEGIVCGLDIAGEVFAALNSKIIYETHSPEGTAVTPDMLVAVATGPAQPLLAGERTALNLVQHLSGIATLTRLYVDLVAGTNCVILDTRKTTPGLRDLEKYAVRCGGGTNHRRDLVQMAMIKDNHRKAIGQQADTLVEAVTTIRQRAPGIPVEIEVDSLDELGAAIAAKPEWILLDNMTIEQMRNAVGLVEGRVKLEASGGITLELVAEIASTGVDAISSGALTHSAPALDISLDIVFEDSVS